jgi:hypothetical protein
MKFVIESSSVPIYNRIAAAFASTLIEFGHTVYFIDTTDFTEANFVSIINNLEFDYYFSTNELNYIQKRSDTKLFFFFEKIEKKLIFIHHDNLFSAFHDLEYIKAKMAALAGINGHSHHFCLEKSNINTLNLFGVSNTSQIYHASEFKIRNTTVDHAYNISFIGHLMSGLNLYPAESIIGGHHLMSLAWSRFSSSAYPVLPRLRQLAEDSNFSNSLCNGDEYAPLLVQHFLIANLNRFSSALRGQVISTIKSESVIIFGGDLSYGRIDHPLMKINQDNIHYQPSTQDYQSANSIYQSSKINLNISSLQFDSAVNNRVIDAVLSGGFILTDRRDDLFAITKYATEISFDTPEELNSKISYFTDPANRNYYFELRDEIHQEFGARFTYQHTVGMILEILSKYYPG